MSRTGRRRPTFPGPYFPSNLDLGRTAPGDAPFVPRGPDNLDVACKESLQKLLKPSHYGMIGPWLNAARTKDKEGVLKLAEAAVGTNGIAPDPTSTHAAMMEPVQQNSKGRAKLCKAVHVTADRAQVDMVRNRCGADQRDVELVKKRRAFNEFAPVHNRDSVSDYYRLNAVPIVKEDSAKVLTEDARRGLVRWQVRAPEQDRETTAQVMSSLRSLSSSVSSLPTYTEHTRFRADPDGSATTSALHDFAAYSVAKRRSHVLGRAGGLTHSRSAPAGTFIPLPTSVIDPKEVSNIQRPGGYVVGLNDIEPIQMRKNKQRNISSKIPLMGGNRDWSTTYGTTMGSALV